MDIVYDIIGTMNKEEVRHLKLFMARTNNNAERKDIQLFDLVRKSYPEHDEEKIHAKLYDTETGKNVLYRLKNRLAEQIDQSLSLQYFENSESNLSFHYISLSRLFYSKHNLKIAIDYLKKAEKKAISTSNNELLDIIYGDFIKLSQEAVSLNPEVYIEKRRNNRKELSNLQQIDDVLAMLIYRIKVSQNFSKDYKLIEVLQKTIDEFTHSKLKKSPQLRFKIYNAVSRMLLQQADYKTLESYLLKTYKAFDKEKLFNQNNHDTKLQMITYVINSLFKNGKIAQSLEFAGILKKAMEEYGKMFYDKYLFYYYNSLVINYSETDKERAVAILEEAKSEKAIQKLPAYTAFIYLNLSVLFFDLKDFKKALKNLVYMKLQDDYRNLDESFRLKINIAELIIRFELNDFDAVEKNLLTLRKEFKDLLKTRGYEADNSFLIIIEKLISTLNVRTDKELLNSIQEIVNNKGNSMSSEVIDYRSWLSEKIK
jgi:hypothetical protein